MIGFSKTQSATIDTTKKGTRAQVTFDANGQEFFDLGHAVRPRDMSRPPGTLDLSQDRLNVPLKQSAIEGAHAIDSQINRRRSLLAFGDQMIKPVFDLIGAEQFGRALVEFGQ